MPKLHRVFERQWLHAAALAVLVGGAAFVAECASARTGHLWGRSSLWWFWVAIGLAILHQVYVWICWRVQLHFSWLTRSLGRGAFPAYSAGFSVLGLARVGAVFALAAANRDTITGGGSVLRILAVAPLIPAAYLFYSVARYFGFRRAFGIDHFDPDFRRVPFVRRGIFRITRNGMYVYGFLLLWVPGLWYGSLAALWVALFNHLYIWVHYYATELPDMRRIYGSRASD